jgi:hypothetical protein
MQPGQPNCQDYDCSSRHCWSDSLGESVRRYGRQSVAQGVTYVAEGEHLRKVRHGYSIVSDVSDSAAMPLTLRPCRPIFAVEVLPKIRHDAYELQLPILQSYPLSALLHPTMPRQTYASRSCAQSRSLPYGFCQSPASTAEYLTLSRGTGVYKVKLVLRTRFGKLQMKMRR